MSNENVEAAKNALESETETDSFVPEGDEETAAGSSDDAPTGLDRFFRTDRGIDLESGADVWDPEGDGGANRVGASIKQAFGVDEWPPIVHLGLGAAEGTRNFIIRIFDFDTNDESEDETEESHVP